MIHSFLCCRKLRDVLQQRLIKFFVDQSKKDAETYAKFFEDYGLFMREGIVTTAEQEVKVRVQVSGPFSLLPWAVEEAGGGQKPELPRTRHWHIWAPQLLLPGSQ